MQYRDRTLRRICIAICLILATYTLTRSLIPAFSTQLGFETARLIGDESRQTTSTNTAHKVALEAHIMSKCPDAKACLQNLVVPAMEKVNDKVDFNMSFIGR